MKECTTSAAQVSRRRFLRWIAIGSAGSLLAACGQSASTSPSAPAQTGPVTLRLRTFLDPRGPSPREQAFASIIERFQKDHQDIQVNIETAPFDQLNTKLIVENESGNVPDVTYLQPQYITQVVQANSLLALDPFISSMGQSWRDEFSSQGLWDQTVIDGKKYTMALGAHTRVLYTRPDLFEKAGLSGSTPPQTLDELVEFGQKLTSGNTYGLGYTMAPAGSTIELTFNALFWGFGGEHLDAAGKAAFNSEAGVKTLDFMRSLVREWKITPEDVLSVPYAELAQQFPEGRFGMMLDGNFRLSGWLEKGMNEQTLAAFPFPSASGKPAPIFTNSWDVGIPAAVPEARQEAAWKLVSYFFKPEINLEYVKAEGSLSPLKSLANDPAFNTPWHKTLGDVLNNYSRTLPKTAYLNEMHDALVKALQSVLLDQQSSQAALDEAAKTYNTAAGVA